MRSEISLWASNTEISLAPQLWSGCFTIFGALDFIRSSVPSRGRVTLFNLQPALRVLPRENPFLSPFCPYHDLRRFYFFIYFLFSADGEEEGGIH